jgi:hypothetical protein
MKELGDYLVTPSAGKWKLILEYGERSYEAIGNINGRWLISTIADL